MKNKKPNFHGSEEICFETVEKKKIDKMFQKRF